MKLKSIKLKSSLARPIDPTYRTNLLLIIVLPILSIVAGGYSYSTANDIWIAVQAGLWMAAAIFESWTIAREIDPDNDWSAFVSIALTVVAMFALNFPIFSVYALFLLLLSLRVVNRIVGYPCTWNDSVGILVMVGVAAFFDSWLIGLVVAAAFFLDATMSQSHRVHLAYAVGAVAIVIVRGIINLGQTGSLSTSYLITIAIIGIFYVLTMLANRSVKVKTDLKAKPVDVRRVRAAMALALIAVIMLAIWRGDAGVIAMLPLWGAMLGISIYRIPITVRELTRFNQARQKA